MLQSLHTGRPAPGDQRLEGVRQPLPLSWGPLELRIPSTEYVERRVVGMPTHTRGRPATSEIYGYDALDVALARDDLRQAHH